MPLDNGLPQVAAPAPCPPQSVVIDGDVMLDIDFQPIIDAINNQTVDLTNEIQLLPAAICAELAPKLQAIVDAINNLQLDPSQYLIPPCQPCIAVSGVVDPNTFVVVNTETGVQEFYNNNGVVADAEILDVCDPRCGCVTCGDQPSPDCEDCGTPAEQQVIAGTIGDNL